MILYPTETIYGLGVNALDEAAVAKLFLLKGREEGKAVSWLARDIEDIARWGELTPVAAKIAEQFLPGPITLVLCARDEVPRTLRGPDGSVSFRVSRDPVAQQLIAEFMAEHDAPLTATSANVSGMEPQPTVSEILTQFGDRARLIDRVIDDGPREGAPSTVVRVLGDEVTVFREGAVSAGAILKVL